MSSFKNNFIIGLGGAGGLSVAAFRRATVVREKEYNAMTSEPEGDEQVRFEYLYVDSSSDQQDNKPLWSAFGKSVRLSDNDYISIGSTPDTFVRAQNSPQVMPWLGDHTLIQNTADGVQRVEMRGAEQMRRFGRVLFALQAPAISAKIKEKIGNLSPKTPSDNITFHVFATLGGGTGSGSLIDLITLICKLCKLQNISQKIYLYLYVGGAGVPTTSNVGRFYENEYTTLRDLNALMTNRYHPHMAAHVPCEEFLNITEEPVSMVYLCSDMAPVRIGQGSIGEQASFMAEACFDIIYSHFSGLEGGLQRAFSGEDRLTSHPAEDNNERSYRFAVLGTKRWCVPTDRIAELLQHLFQNIVLNRWLNGTDNAKEVQMRFDKSHVKYAPLLDLEEKMGTKNFITAANVDQYLTQKIKQIDAEFTKAQERDYAPDTLEYLTNKTLNLIEHIAADFDAPDFLHRFDDDIKVDAEAIASSFKRALAEKRQWRNGNQAWGLRDQQECINKLSQFIEGKRQECKKASIDISQQGRMTERSKEWEKISIISKHLPVVEKLLREHQSEALGLVGNAVEALRLRIYKRFYDILDKELSNMLHALKTCIERMKAEAKKHKNEYVTIYTSLTGSAKEANHTIKYDFDSDNLKNIMDYLKGSASAAYIERAMQELETMCWARVWQPNETTQFYTSDTDCTNHLPELFSKLQEQDCAWRISRETVEDITRKEAEYKNVYHDSLYGRLHERWATKSTVDRKREIIGFLSTLCTSARITPVAPMVEDGNTAPINAMALGLPMHDTSGQYKDVIANTIKENLGAKVSSSGQDFAAYGMDSDSELRILYCQYWMPARFTDVVSSCLNSKFQDALNNKTGEEKKRLLYLTNLDDKGIQESLEPNERPSLMKPLASDREFQNCLEMLCMLPVSSQSKDCIAIKKDGPGVKDKHFYIAEKVNLPSGQTPEYQEYSWNQMRNPRPETSVHAHAMLRECVALMGDAERESFMKDVEAQITELSSKKAEGALDPEVRAMQTFRKYIEKKFNEISHVSPKHV